MFLLNRSLARDDVADGLSNTLFVGEKRAFSDDLGWLSGTRATLRNGGLIDSQGNVISVPSATAVGPAGSMHPGGAMMLFGSGETKFVTTQTDQRVLVQWINRQDGGIPIEMKPLIR